VIRGLTDRLTERLIYRLKLGLTWFRAALV
jgi:hypothetical protein